MLLVRMARYVTPTCFVSLSQYNILIYIRISGEILTDKHRILSKKEFQKEKENLRRRVIYKKMHHFVFFLCWFCESIVIIRC